MISGEIRFLVSYGSGHMISGEIRFPVSYGSLVIKTEESVLQMVTTYVYDMMTSVWGAQDVLI